MSQMNRICTGCAVQLRDDHVGSFCCEDCQFEFELTEAYCNNVYRMLDAQVNHCIAASD